MSKRGERISEEKARKLAIGATVGGVLLIVFLAVILCVQFVQIGVGNAKKRRLNEEIEHYESLIDKGDMDLDWYRSGNGLYWYARSYGYT